MAYSLSYDSKQKIIKVHPNLVKIIDKVMSYQYMDFTIIEGTRSPQRQAQLLKAGTTQTLDSKHIIQSDGYGHAVDLAPFPVNWNDSGRFYLLAGMVRAAATELGIKIRQGCDWNGDGQVLDSKFHDLPHIELL